MVYTSSSAGVSFLLCTFNGAARIAETLVSLAAQQVPPGASWEVICVDNASTDATAEQARQTWLAVGAPAPLILLHESRPGKQYALHTAIGQVRYACTCIVDDDNRLAPDYLRVGLELLEANPRIGILGGPNTATFDSPEPAWFAAFQHCYAVGPQPDRAAGGFAPLADGSVGRNVLWGAGMFVRTALWHELEQAGFQSLFSGRQGEANLTAGEDDELCYAAQLLGYEVWYSSRLRLRHHMAAGRLTKHYRNQLFYASARSATRLNAYRNALWGKPSVVGKNLLKDTGYLLVSVLRSVFSPAFGRAILRGNPMPWMSQRHTLGIVRDVLLHFGQVKGYYQHVLQLKQKLRAIDLPQEQRAWYTSP